MKKVTLLIVVFISFAKSYSQEIYLQTGKNFTSYAYKADDIDSVEFSTGLGNYYEIGYSKHFKNVYSYTLGLSLNQYNAIVESSDGVVDYITEYVGVQNAIQLRVFKIKFVEVDAKAGINLATILYVKQSNSVVDDLTRQSEYKGLIFQPLLGIEVKLKLISQGYLSVGYNRTNSYNLSNTNRTEDVKFKTDQISFGVHFQK
jgi:hypothetical protein